MSSNLTYAAPWRECEVSERMSLNDELAKEISDEHSLYNTSFDAVARRTGSNQTLFRLEGAVFDWVVVHLTFAGQVVDDDLPDVDFYLTREEWIMRCMNCPWS